MELQDKLNEMKEKFQETAPPEAVAVMHEATEELANSGILDRVLKVGDTFPQVTLADQDGNDVDISTVYAQGPLVVTVYRGVW